MDGTTELPASRERALYLAVIFFIGFTALVYEVYSVEVLFLFFAESTHAVALAISAFLAGIATSSLLFSRLATGGAINRRLIFWMQLIVAVYAYTVLRHYDFIPVAVDWLAARMAEPSLLGLARAGLIWFYLFIPAFFIGGAFPLVNGLYLASRESGTRDTGIVYFWDTAGAIAGALCAGFWLLPELGYRVTVIGTLSINLVVAAVLARGGAWKMALVLLTAILLLVELRPSNPPVSSEQPASERTAAAPLAPQHPALDERFGRVLFQQMSPFGRVTVGTDVLQIPGNKALFINYRDMCQSIDHESESILGQIAARGLNAGAKVLNIGLGCGFTASSLAASPSVKQLEIVEINPVVAEAAAAYFHGENGGVLQLPKTKLHILDGAEFVRQSTESYDAVVIDIEEVSVIYSSPLYTREYFEILRQRLAPGGRLALWAQTGSPEFEKVIYNTLRAVFPHVHVRIIDETYYTFYAAENALAIEPADAAEAARVEELLTTPVEAINTLDNRALEKYFDIRVFFALPYDYRERFVMDRSP